MGYGKAGVRGPQEGKKEVFVGPDGRRIGVRIGVEWNTSSCKETGRVKRGGT